ncbi:hypothetical protein [Paracraurococcus lichenis]|uniref:Helix-turn-helix domain-containing protein n=1 Tax=Paracraurococcus lichenis TaxID=3064888 RepID=A0ABT9E8Q0_9PROT|nr:hypothetical protein [Paracraurococcus sp. LOR1-02]MDO9712484.1 hypothetical protein [Paracraurococcus sp. LOR1-02]
MFWILTPQQAFAVGFWMVGFSDRPLVGALLWLSLFRYVDINTGEILLSPSELAVATGVSERDTVRVLRQLEQINALRRRLVRVRGVRGPGVARYYVNPNCPEHIPPPENLAERGQNRSRRALVVQPKPKFDDTSEVRIFLADVLEAANEAVRTEGLDVTARSIQRDVPLPRTVAMAVLEGAKQRVRIAKAQESLPPAPDED